MNIAVQKYFKRQNIALHSAMHVADDKGIFVVIPAYGENETLPFCLNFLLAANIDGLCVNVIVVVNYAANDTELLKSASETVALDCEQFAQKHNSASFKLVVIRAYNLDPKVKGAGLARKIGMDQVLAYCVHRSTDDAIIVSLDADTTVSSNYLVEIARFFNTSNYTACSIHFEHPVGNSLELTFNEQAIVLYELHLRYYRQALRSAGFPFAIHTVGSAMACTLIAYAKAGGMTQKQAGEDFYFLHKLVRQGGFANLCTTTVYPSCRASTRVVFGTGATVQKMIDDSELYYHSYNLQSFIDLKALFDKVELLYTVNSSEYNELLLNLSGRMRSFLLSIGFDKLIEPIIGHCATVQTFQKRFFEVFDAFLIIKYLNFTHEHFLDKPSVVDVAMQFLDKNNLLENPFADNLTLLGYYRKLDLLDGKPLAL